MDFRGRRYDIVMRNAKNWLPNKVCIRDILKANNQVGQYTVIACRRVSNRGADEPIYLIGGGYGYESFPGTSTYIVDTGNGYGGTGVLIIEGIMRCSYSNLANVMNKQYFKENRTVWVMK